MNFSRKSGKDRHKCHCQSHDLTLDFGSKILQNAAHPYPLQKMSERLDRDDLDKAHEEGEDAKKVVDQTTEFGRSMKEDLKEAYERYAKSTGDFETAKKYMGKLDKCKTDAEVMSFREKAETASLKWLEGQLKDAFLGKEIDGRERSRLEGIIQGNLKAFGELPLNGTYSKMDFIEGLRENIDPQLEFREKLRAKCEKNPVLKETYFLKLNLLPPYGSEKDLLEKTEKELGVLKEKPIAVKNAFEAKLLKGAAEGDPNKLLEDLDREYKQLEAPYIKTILDSEDAWGGEKVVTPEGKMGQAAADYIKWFRDQSSLEEMRWALGELPKHIARRREMYAERDELIARLEPNDAARLKEDTNAMRSTALEVALPRLREHVNKNDVKLARYDAALIGAERHSVPLYSPEEIKTLTDRFKEAKQESRNARLLLLDEEIADRGEVVDKYFKVPDYMRDDMKFYGLKSAAERQEMVKEIEKKLKDRPDSPFDISKVKHKTMNSADVENVAGSLETQAGKDAFREKVMQDLKAEGQLKISETINAVQQKAGLSMKRQNDLDLTQAQSKQYDNAHWMGIDKNIKDASEASTDRERWRGNAQKAVAEAWKMDKTWDASGGPIKKLSKVSLEQIASGSGEVKEEVGRAQWAEDVKIVNAAGEDVRNPLIHMKALAKRELKRLGERAKEKFLDKELQVGLNNRILMNNSGKLDQAIQNALMEEAFRPANNPRYLELEDLAA